MKLFRLTLLSVLASCNPQGFTNVVGDATSQTKTIDEQGGTLSLAGATLDIPAGALASPVAITMTATTVNFSQYQMYTPFYAFEPNGLELATPATLTLTSPYTLAKDVMMLGTVHAGGPTVTWLQDLRGTASGKTITGQVRHFSGIGGGHIPPCDDDQEREECKHVSPWCGRIMVGATKNSGYRQYSSLQSFGFGIGTWMAPDECFIDCDCPQPAPPTIEWAGGDDVPIVGEFSSTTDSVVCDATSVQYLDLNQYDSMDDKKFNWKCDEHTSTLSDAVDGTVLYQGDMPASAAISWGYGGTLPTITMTGTDAAHPGTVTLSGSFVCTYSTIPMAPAEDMSVNSAHDMGPTDLASGHDMAMSGAPVITAIQMSDNAQVVGRGAPGTQVNIIGTHLSNPEGITGPITMFWGSTLGGSVGVVSDTELTAAVPDAATYATVNVTLSNARGTSAPYSFAISCNMAGEQCASAPGGTGNGCCSTHCGSVCN